MGNISSVGLSNVTGFADSTASGAGSINDLLATQYQQGLELAQIQAQSGIIQNFTQALQEVARNVGG